LTSPLGQKAGIGKRYWLAAAVLTLAFVCAYVGLVVWVDNTVVGTSNGLWKSVEVAAWSHGSGFPVDSGGILYSAGYGKLTRLIPDGMVRYGVPAPILTFRKMAMLNAIFGGLSCGLIFLLGLRFTGSPWMAGILALAHAGAAFVLVNSINSEDVIPAYTFFLASTVCFFEFLYVGGVGLFVSSAVLLALATLFHWTLMAPALASFGAVYACLLPKGRRFFAMGLAWLATFLVSIRLVLLLAFPGRHTTLWEVVYPDKAGGGGWVGMLQSKHWFSLVGMGNYFSGGYNVSEYRIPFENPSLLRLMISSWTVLVAALVICLVVILRRRTEYGTKLLAVSGLALFLAGEMGALYSQPQDPQMQIEPMLIVVEGLILWASLAMAGGTVWRRGVATVFLAMAAVNGYWNVHLIAQRYRGGDSVAASGIKELDRLFPKSRTMLVSQGFEQWVGWHFVLDGYRDFGEYSDHNALLTFVFVTQRGVSAADAAVAVEKQIDAAMASGMRVVADNIWTEPLEQSVAAFGTVVEEATARTFLSILKARYRMGTRWTTPDGPFVEILPPQPGSSQPL
jgi:hypothetical protein